ncbi:protein kinase domain-containing protein [Streptomyces alkaliterrae]|uniref:PQQ-binding-like beta-propeller repeat protein n=1 Tax=Streptomyces alkaliterrae TaxID=2213162 RepID=A0A5P0YU66_9ACTN|nr:serine/threonine-protein kinase [Streptomyces alkaliterrae]MBB1261563.1 PQQ-binding-like beta-propeller repeat protein [Streptomyces alkaliterrae]MQS03851.1 PQQ-binding-like beta-propeller repeat protein [Streptomyces alkaliterrae]
MSSTTPTPAPTDTHIGPYRVIRELGAGGMGRVLLAASPSGRAVAVKVVRPELAADPDFRRRFASEVAAARAVSGAFTAPVLDADPDGPRPWLATAYVPGPDLGEAIEAHGPMPEATLRVLGAGLAEALAAIHRAGLIHRDLKPSNILLTRDGPRVIDFGISRAVDGTRLTAEGQVVGSPGFMAPEQVRGAALTPAGDVFSLGAVLAYAATGTPPFGTGAVHALLYRAVHEAPRLDGVPHALLGVLSACLDKEPDRRPSVEWLREALRPTTTTADWLGAVARQIAAEERTLREAVRPPRLSRRRLLAAGGGALAVAATGAGAALLIRSRDREKPVALPELLWTRALPHSDMTLHAVTESRLLVTGKTSAAVLDRAGGKPLWQDLSGRNGDVRADEKHVYAVRADGRVHTFDGRTGRELWDAAPPGGDAPRLEAATGSVLVTAAGERLHGLDAATGETRWKVTVPGLVFARRLSPSGHVIAEGDAAGEPGLATRHHALDPATGRTAWTADLLGLHSPAEGRLVYGLDDKMRVLALDAATGERRWRATDRLPPALGLPVFYGNALSVDDEAGILFCHPAGANEGKNGYLAAFDTRDGEFLWRVRRSLPAGVGQHARAGTTVCYLDRKTLHAVDSRTGKRRWTADGLGEPDSLSASGDLLLTSTRGGLHGLHADTGERLWHHPVSGGADDPLWTVNAGDRLFATKSGTLMCFSLPGEG